MQGGLHAANTIRRRLKGDTRDVPFTYRDLGSAAAIGRFKAIVNFHGVRLSGFPGWTVWLFVHLAFLNGFGNRVARCGAGPLDDRQRPPRTGLQRRPHRRRPQPAGGGPAPRHAQPVPRLRGDGEAAGVRRASSVEQGRWPTTERVPGTAADHDYGGRDEPRGGMVERQATQPESTKARLEEWFETSIIHPIEDFQDPKQEWRRLFSELLGTFFLVLVAAGGGMMGQAFPDTISRSRGGDGAGADGDGDHPVHGQGVRRPSQPGGEPGVRRPRGLPVASGARLHRRAARRRHAGRAVPARRHRRVGHVRLELPGSGLLGDGARSGWSSSSRSGWSA